MEIIKLPFTAFLTEIKMGSLLATFMLVKDTFASHFPKTIGKFREASDNFIAEWTRYFLLNPSTVFHTCQRVMKLAYNIGEKFFRGIVTKLVK